MCRIKNKFAAPKSELVGGYCDLMVCVLFEVKTPFVDTEQNSICVLGEDDKDEWLSIGHSQL